MIDASQIANTLRRARQARPRVHCLVNSVAQKLVADGLSVLGATPSMTSSLEEIADFAASANGLLVNLGTLHAEQRRVIAIAMDVMNECDLPVVLDPVFCDVSSFRLDFARQLLERNVTVVRGNVREIGALGDIDALTAKTGSVDWISDGKRHVGVANGHPYLTMISGTGCLSGALIAAFLPVEADPLLAAVSAQAVLGIAAEMAAEVSAGPGSFTPALLDALHYLDADMIEARLRIEHV